MNFIKLFWHRNLHGTRRLQIVSLSEKYEHNVSAFRWELLIKFDWWIIRCLPRKCDERDIYKSFNEKESLLLCVVNVEFRFLFPIIKCNGLSKLYNKKNPKLKYKFIVLSILNIYLLHGIMKNNNCINFHLKINSYSWNRWN